ncbi:hypothetical protein Y032_0558g3432 [Ancylostoma ceylanicum]|uniref:Uncharacterized protein n=1 Tax=Ancylostoma ceylanicum TaxID=53326 RepID=A0A016WQ81_9BILA|nr:hypothetical protein Y032_0558g3432 [Ancylostoma ceylanicum]
MKVYSETSLSRAPLDLLLSTFTSSHAFIAGCVIVPICITPTPGESHAFTFAGVITLLFLIIDIKYDEQLLRKPRFATTATIPSGTPSRSRRVFFEAAEGPPQSAPILSD